MEYLSYIYFSIITDKYIGFIIPRANGGHVIGYGKTISTLDWDTKNVSLITEVDTNVVTNVNDAKCDTRGRLWFGKNTY